MRENEQEVTGEQSERERIGSRQITGLDTGREREREYTLYMLGLY